MEKTYNLEGTGTGGNIEVVSVKTLGEKMVRTDFNVTKDSTVDQIKQKTAELINLVETLKEKDARLAEMAQSYYEGAAMYAVKAATATSENSY